MSVNDGTDDDGFVADEDKAEALAAATISPETVAPASVPAADSTPLA